MATGNIQFRPVAGDGPSAGATIQDGKFTAEVPVTKMKVEITANKVIGQRKAYDMPNSPTVDEVVELIPKRYNVASELTLDVQPASCIQWRWIRGLRRGSSPAVERATPPRFLLVARP